MPRLMDKKDWMQTMTEMGAAENIWCENVIGNAHNMTFSLPETGRYRVILVKLEDVPEKQTPLRIPGNRKISPKVRALRGAARLDDDRDYRDILADARTEKYEALG